MKQIVFGILIGFNFVLARPVQSPQHLFEQANQAYQNQDFQTALGLYQEIEKQNLESGELYFNLGNVYYRLNAPGMSRLYYEKAAQLLPGDEAVQTNIGLLKSRLADQIQETPGFFLDQWLSRLLHFQPINRLLWLFALLWAALTLTWLWHLYQTKFRQGNGLRGTVLSLSVITGLVLLLVSARLIADHNRREAVVMAVSVTVKTAPGTPSTEAFVLHEGTKVSILRRQNQWLEIRLEDGKTGWLPEEHVKNI